MKRLLSVLLSCVMLLCMLLPTTAFALEAEPFSAAVTTKIAVTVTNQSGNPLSGVVFNLYRWDGLFVGQLTTGTNGRAESADMSVDSGYYLEEVTPPVGYQRLPNIIQIPQSSIVPSAYTEVTIPYTSITGMVMALVTDQFGSVVSGAGLYVYRTSPRELVAAVTTGNDGKAVTPDLPYGQYEVLQYIVPTGYTGATVTYASITEQGKTVAVELVNNKASVYGKVKVTAKDDTGAALSGVVYGVYQNSTLIEEIVTGYDGTAMSNSLSTGEYYLFERTTLTGYVPDTTRYRFNVTTDNSVVNIAKQRVSGNLWVKKTDGYNPLSGVTFGIYKANKKITELKTGRDGTVTSDTLYFGDYELRELSTIDGYELMTTPIPFSITTHGEVVRKTVTASMSFGTVKVTVTGEDDERLSGVVFDVYNTDTGDKVTTITTAWNGMVSEDLPVGRYYLKQTKTNVGYVLPKNSVPFIIKSSGQTVSLTVTNQKKPPLTGFLRIIKKSDGTGALLSGATFGVYDYATGIKVKELTTGKDGTATLELNEGSYYLVEIKPPVDYELNKEKVSFPVQGGEVTEIISKGKSLVPETTPTPTPTPTPKPTPTPTPSTPSNPAGSGQTKPSASGTLQLYVHGEQTGNKLSGAFFTVHKANGEKVSDISTGNGGTASLSLSVGDYYLLQTRATVGFMRETVKIPFIIKASVTTVVDVTNMKSDMPVIDIPKTGEDYPTMNYALSVLFMGIAVLCGVALYRRRETV